MTRGKKAAGAARRRNFQEAAQRVSLISEIRHEQDLLAAAQAAAGLVADIDARTQAATRRRDRAVAPEIAQLAAEIALWEQLRERGRSLERRATDINNRLLTTTQDYFGGEIAGFEAAVGLLGVDAHIRPETPGTRRLSGDAIGAIERARGVMHRPLDTDFALDQGLGAMVPERLIADALAAGMTRDTRLSAAVGDNKPVFEEAAARVWLAISKPPTTLSEHTLGLWRPSPLGYEMPVALLDQLGAPAARLWPGEAITVPPDPVPGPSATLSMASRQRLASSVPPAELLKHWSADMSWAASLATRVDRYETPWARRPRVARPVDAALLRAHYFLAGIGQLLREEGQQTPGLAEVAVGCGSAAPHWIPPGQTVAFIDSDPMPDASRDDLRLPFPQVFVAFADPLRVPPVAGAPEPALASALAKLPEGLKDVGHPEATLKELVPAHGTLPSVVDFYGAWVEGVVLLSDSLGRPLDTIGWCIAVLPSPSVAIARLLVPASRQACKVPGIIDSIEAILAWAGWDAPDAGTAAPVNPRTDLVKTMLDDPRADQDSYRTDLGGVHVLNLRRTRTASDSHGDGTGPSVAPHLRRGHWRRQRVGVGRAETQWVRVAATVVNAGKGTIAPQVYRLPITAASPDATSR